MSERHTGVEKPAAKISTQFWGCEYWLAIHRSQLEEQEKEQEKATKEWFETLRKSRETLEKVTKKN